VVRPPEDVVSLQGQTRDILQLMISAGDGLYFPEALTPYLHALHKHLPGMLLKCYEWGIPLKAFCCEVGVLFIIFFLCFFC